MFVFRFQAAIKKYGVPEEEIFQTADLFERRNIPQVFFGCFVFVNAENLSFSLL